MSHSAAPFDPIAIINALNRHGVRYVVIGGIAAGVQGAVWVTADLDIVYAREREDLAKLSAALDELGATPVDLVEGLRVRLDARGLAAGSTWTLWTKHGRLDLLDEPASGLTYAALAERARTIRASAVYQVAAVEDLITMKRAAARPKDAGHIELLERLKAMKLDTRSGGGSQ